VDNGYFETLFKYDWVLTKPGRRHQWVAKDAEAIIPDAHVTGRSASPRC
jgi:catalase-peroxidase